jgi:dihydropyrimidine dehydrogenase (NAD+) subunit PreA
LGQRFCGERQPPDLTGRLDNAQSQKPKVQSREAEGRPRYSKRFQGEGAMMASQLGVTFTGLRFENPFLLASAPPTESDSNIMRAFDAGWGGVVTKTIGLHPVVNVAGPKTKFLRATPDSPHLSMQKRPGTALHSSWNWELISDKPLDWWVPRIARIKAAHPARILVASIMAGSGSDQELAHWQTLARACQDEGADALELNLSCPHMDRQDMGSNIGKDQELISIVTQVVKEVARVPVWAKLTPSTTDIVVEARGAFLGGADAITSSNTFPSLPLIDPETLDFEVNVDGYVSSGGLGGPAILPLSLAKMSQLTQAFPDRSFSGIGGIAEFAHALNYFLLGCGTVQVCTAAMLDRAIGPNVLQKLLAGMAAAMERHGWASLDDFCGTLRDRVVVHSKIRRLDAEAYHGGYEAEGYAPTDLPAPALGPRV